MLRSPMAVFRYIPPTIRQRHASLFACFVSLVCVSLFTACKPEVSPIVYGQDACNYCSMGVVDKQHGAEIVTTKGKVYKYDAIECMLGDIKNFNSATIALLLVNTYDSPGELQPATEKTYLISENLRSPMSANLTAFNSEVSAKQMLEQKGGTLYDWDSLREHFKNTKMNGELH